MFNGVKPALLAFSFPTMHPPSYNALLLVWLYSMPLNSRALYPKRVKELFINKYFLHLSGRVLYNMDARLLGADLATIKRIVLEGSDFRFCLR